MHASISVGYIYVINEILNMIRMHSILMIEDYVYIYMDFKLLFIENLLVFIYHDELFYIFIYILVLK